jgi:chaperonin GroES
MAHIRPLGKRVLVKRSKAKASKGGILLPDTAQEKPKEGIVIAVGPGTVDDQGNHQSVNIQKDDRIVFGPYAGTEVKSDDGEEYLILSEDEIFGVLT